MKNVISRSLYLLALIVTVLTACRKDPEVIIRNPDNPGTPGNTNPRNFQFVVDSLPGGVQYAVSSINAVVSVASKEGEAVLTDKMLTFSFNGKYRTENLSLPAGDYRLTAFRIVYGSVMTHFAAPLAYSAAAAKVQKPLALPFTVTPSGNAEVPVEILRVKEGERPEHFGYPSGAFDNNQENENPFLKIKVKVAVKVGDIVYDSIRTSLRLTTWSSNDMATTTYVALLGGENEITLPKSALKYELHVSALGVTDKKVLMREDVKGGELFEMGGSKAAKRLQSEVSLRLVNGQYIADSKNVYTYNASGQLAGVAYYLKRKDNTPYLAMKDDFVYVNNQVERINRYDEKEALVGFTSFIYDGQGRIVKMKEKRYDIETNADVEYTPMPAINTTAIKISYQYSHNNKTMTYYMGINGGNKIEESAFTNNASSEMGRYYYDSGINPYAHMNWPDIFFSRLSKNNVSSQQKTYSGAYPTADPYVFNYTYDNDGYAKEVIRHFHSPITHEFLYKTKTVYTYQ